MTNANASSTPRTASLRLRRRLHRTDSASIDRALPSEIALRSIEPHSMLRR